jgi:hypothetical protein
LRHTASGNQGHRPHCGGRLQKPASIELLAQNQPS